MDREFLVGVDLTASQINAGLVDLNGKVIKKITLPTEAEKGKKRVVDNIFNAVSKVSKPKVVGVGISVPGQVSRERGYVLGSSDLGWTDVPLRRLVEEKLKLPVFIENDSNCFALAEFKCGEGNKMKNMVGLIIGNTICSGVIADGKLFRGCSDAAGEIGHTVIHPEGPKCSCGNNGCLEAFASEKNIINMYKAAKGKVKNPTLQLIAEASRNGDEKARETLRNASKYLGIGLSNMVSVFNPELIVISGSVANTKEILEPAVKEFQKRALKNSASRVRISPSHLEDAGILGAASVVMKGFY